MGKIRSEIDDEARQFIEAQHVFFVASAPLDAGGHVNLSPKGLVRHFAFLVRPAWLTSISTEAA